MADAALGPAIVAAVAAISGVVIGTASQAFLAGRQRNWAVADERIRWERDKQVDACAEFANALQRFALEAVARATLAQSRGTSADADRATLLEMLVPVAAARARIELLGSEDLVLRTNQTWDAALALPGGLEDSDAFWASWREYGASVEQWRHAVRTDIRGGVAET